MHCTGEFDFKNNFYFQPTVHIYAHLKKCILKLERNIGLIAKEHSIFDLFQNFL